MRAGRTAVLLAVLLVGATAFAASYTTITASAVNVAATSTLALADNPARNFLEIQNDSDTVIWCTFNSAAVANAGLRLNASGGSVLYDITIPRGPLYCIHGSSGNKVLLVKQGVQ